MPRRVARLAGLLAVATLLAAACGRSEQPRPTGVAGRNVLLITLDALRQDHLSFNGYERQTSPNIDWLARRGTVFSNMVPTGCSTKTSLTSLFVSQGYRHHQIISHGGVLSDEFLTLAEMFRSAGYETGGFVATPHLLAEMQYDQGFNHYEDFTTGNERGAGRFLGADQVVDAAIGYLRQRQGHRPFFAYVHLEEPHPPWIHGSPWLEGEEKANQFFLCLEIPSDEDFAAVDQAKKRNLVAKYDGAISFADAQIGRLLDHLRERQMLENTVVAVSTDHGIELLERFSASHGLNPFDEVVKTFLVLYDPDGAHRPDEVAQGRIFDIGPTLLRLVGLPVPEDFHGVDLLNDTKSLPEFAFAQCYNGEVVRSPRYKLVRISKPPRGSRLAEKHLPPGQRLFDLVEDPGETEDVQAHHPVQIGRMQEALWRYLADLDREKEFPRELSDEELGGEVLERLRMLGYVE